MTKTTSFLKRFTLRNLNGYKTVTLNCKSSTKIVNGDNGSGKTSLLNALYGILAGKQALLHAINFDSFELEWSNGTVISASKIELFGNIDTESILAAGGIEFFTENGVSESEAIEMISSYILGDEEAVVASPGYKIIYGDTPYDRDDILQGCSRVAKKIKSTGLFSETHQKIKELLGDTSVLYLPTYRRIEADLPEFRTRPTNNFLRKNISKDNWNSDRLINFGLEDVEQKLNSISTLIRRETLASYSRISGKALEELISINDFETPPIPTEKDIPSIQLVLSRIGRQSTATESKIENLIREELIGDTKYVQLRRFLAQLQEIYAERQKEEQAIEDFANLINEYLKNPGPAEKEFVFDKQRVELQVKNKFTGKYLKLGALSSGEKQIVSVFARLLLDPNKRYFIIIDEPELSLSIEWQERFLLDINSNSNCAQLIAVTHSPFIFHNELAAVSGSLEVEMTEISQ